MPTGSADGLIQPGEYAHQVDARGVQLYWSNDATYLYMAMEGETTGWIAVGIEPTQGMKDADFIFGYVENGQAQLWDAFGTAPTGPNHPPDEDLGGTNDIVAFAGAEAGGMTRFEFQIPLNSGDAYDKVLTPGNTYTIIVAMGNADDYNGYHSMAARSELTLDN